MSPFALACLPGVHVSHRVPAIGHCLLCFQSLACCFATRLMQSCGMHTECLAISQPLQKCVLCDVTCASLTILVAANVL